MPTISNGARRTISRQQGELGGSDGRARARYVQQDRCTKHCASRGAAQLVEARAIKTGVATASSPPNSGWRVRGGWPGWGSGYAAGDSMFGGDVSIESPAALETSGSCLDDRGSRSDWGRAA
jgi:hypothetical protein